MNMRVHQTKARPIRMGASSLAWVDALPIPEKGQHYAGSVWELGAHIAEIRTCLDEQINSGRFQPVVISQHDSADGLALGRVRKARLLDTASAAKLGIKQAHPYSVYFGIEWTDAATATAWKQGKVAFVSPGFAGSLVEMPYKDETGKDWPMFFFELSIVDQPHNTTQTPADALRGIQMRRHGAHPQRRVNMDKEAMVAAMTEALTAMAPGFVDAIMSSITIGPGAPDTAVEDAEEVVEEVDDAAEMETEEDEAAEMASELPKDLQMGAAAKRIAALERQLATMGAEKRVDAAMAKRSFTSSRSDLVSMAVAHPKAFDLVVANAPAKPSASVKMAQPATSKELPLADRLRQSVAKMSTTQEKVRAVQTAWKEGIGNV